MRTEKVLLIVAAVGGVLACSGVFFRMPVVTDIGAITIAGPILVAIARLFVRPPKIVDVVNAEMTGLPRYENPDELSSSEAKSVLRDTGAEHRAK